MTSTQKSQAAAFLVSSQTLRLWNSLPPVADIFAKFTGGLSALGTIALATIEAVGDPKLKQDFADFCVVQLKAVIRVVEAAGRGEKVDLSTQPLGTDVKR